jgi:hypothetical protein
MFLGPTMPVQPPAIIISKGAECLTGKNKMPPFVAVEGSGVMINEKITDVERATLIGHAQVVMSVEKHSSAGMLSVPKS